MRPVQKQGMTDEARAGIDILRKAKGIGVYRQC